MTENREEAKLFVTKGLPKIVERLTIAKVNMDNGIDINEGDLKIIESIHKLCHEGEIEVESLSSVDSDNIVKQYGLFDAMLSGFSDGTEVEPLDA